MSGHGDDLFSSQSLYRTLGWLPGVNIYRYTIHEDHEVFGYRHMSAHVGGDDHKFVRAWLG